MPIKQMPPPSAFPAYTPRSFFRHEVLHESRREGSRARVGRLHTPHGIVDTPGFVVVGTNGAVKFVDHRAADDAGMQLMFANTLHLLVHPGPNTVEQAGGLHNFMNRRERPLITDSGGFQIFSFAHRGELAMPGRDGAGSASAGAIERTDAADDGDGADGPAEAAPWRVAEDVADLKSTSPDGKRARRSAYAGDGQLAGVQVTEEGAVFRSYRDGQKLFISPETSVEAQKAFGAGTRRAWPEPATSAGLACPPI